jgi:hypothetical protein
MGIGGDVLGLLIGIVSSLVFLLLLFSVKPRLHLTWVRVPVYNTRPKKSGLTQSLGSEPESTSPAPPEVVTCSQCGASVRPASTRACTCEAHYRVAVENLGLGRVVEIEARLWLLVRSGDAVPTRKRVTFQPDTLLELPGKWREACRTSHERDDLKVGDRLYRFRLPCEVSAAALSGKDAYFLFQIWSKHGFTNFGRLHLLRIIEKDACLLDDNAYAQLGRRPSFAPIATAVATIAGFAVRWRKHLHRFEPQRAYVTHELNSRSPRTVVPMLCACGEIDTRSVPGKKDIDQVLRELQDYPDLQ